MNGERPGWLDLVKGLPTWAQFSLVAIAVNFPAALALYLVLYLTGAVGTSPVQAAVDEMKTQHTQILGAVSGVMDASRRMVYYNYRLCVNTSKTAAELQQCVYPEGP